MTMMKMHICNWANTDHKCVNQSRCLHAHTASGRRPIRQNDCKHMRTCGFRRRGLYYYTNYLLPLTYEATITEHWDVKLLTPDTTFTGFGRKQTIPVLPSSSASLLPWVYWKGHIWQKKIWTLRPVPCHTQTHECFPIKPWGLLFEKCRENISKCVRRSPYSTKDDLEDERAQWGHAVKS